MSDLNSSSLHIERAGEVQFSAVLSVSAKLQNSILKSISNLFIFHLKYLTIWVANLLLNQHTDPGKL